MTLSLTELVAQAKARVATADNAKVAEKKAKSARTETERVASQIEANALRATLDWQTQALVLVFDAWECRCGRRGRSPQGVFFLQEHTRLSNSTRLVSPRHRSEITDDLPRRVKDETRIVAVCQRCAPSIGFFKEYIAPLPPAERKIALRLPGPFVREWMELRKPTREENP